MSYHLAFLDTYGSNYNEDFFAKLIAKTFKTLMIPGDLSIISLTLMGDEIRAINYQYRQIDAATDVLAFAFNDASAEINIIADGLPVTLGDIIINVAQAQRQAKNGLDAEMKLLFVHGLLHLLQYDHDTQEREAIMFGLQEEIVHE